MTKRVSFAISAKETRWQILQGSVVQGAYTGALADLEILVEGEENAIQGDAAAATDRLVLTTNGAEFTFTLDGKIVYTLPVADYRTGQVGFIVITQADVTKVHIHYHFGCPFCAGGKANCSSATCLSLTIP